MAEGVQCGGLGLQEAQAAGPEEASFEGEQRMPYFFSDAWRTLFAQIEEHTLVPQPAVRFYVNAVLGCIHRKVPGVIVECGCWFAGASLAVCLAQRARYGRVVKPVWLLDSFQGLEAPGPKDGNYARFFGRNRGETGPGTPLSEQAQAFFANSAARSAVLHPEAVEALFNAHGFLPGRDIFVTPGWVRDTVPALSGRLMGQGISVLRLDVDLYEATGQCLALEPLVADHGLVLVDDYYHFDGCALAVHEHLSVPDHPYKLRGQPGQGVFWEKRKPESFEFVPEWPYLEKIL